MKNYEVKSLERHKANLVDLVRLQNNLRLAKVLRTRTPIVSKLRVTY